MKACRRPCKRTSSRLRSSVAVLLACACATSVFAQGPAGTVPPAPPASVTSATSASSSDAFTEFSRLFEARQYEAAVPYAERVLADAEKAATQPSAEEVQVALMNLATTQQLAGDHLGAERNYQRVIELVQSSGRPLHARLARAYAGLASAYHDENRHDQAVAAFEQALRLTRRHEGLLSDQQVPLLEKYVDSLTELGRYDTALTAQRYLLRIAVREYGAAGLEVAPRLERIGQWYARIGAYDQSRRVLKRAIEIIEDAEGENSPRLIGPLVTLAATDRKQLLDPVPPPVEAMPPQRAAAFQEPGFPAPTVSQSTLTAEGERALLRAAQIAEQRPDPSPLQVADVRTQIGDWFQSRDQSERALENYRRAWAAASGAKAVGAQGKPLTELLFGEPMLLQVVRPDGWSRYSQRPPEEIEVRSVRLEFTVDTSGRIVEPRVVDDAGDAKRGERTLAAVAKSARYRPRMVDGEPVPTAGVSWSQPWIVLRPEARPDAETEVTKDTAPVAAPPPDVSEADPREP